MISGLLIVALLLTALLAVSLPFGGWGPGMDAAGKGMAMFFPLIFMVARDSCFAVVIALLAGRGVFGWSGLPGIGAAAVALALVGGVGASSFAAASLLVQAPRTYGRGSYAFLAVIVAPVVVVIWLFAEAYGAAPAQAWVVRGLVLLAALGPLPLLLAIRRHQREMSTLSDAQEQAEDEAATAYAGRLPADATFLDALRFYDAIPDDTWKARDIVISRITSMAGRDEAFMRALSSGSWEDRILVAFHATALSPPATLPYFDAARPLVEEVVRLLQDPSVPTGELVRETAAAIRIAWPAIHTDRLPKSLMAAFLSGVEARAPGTPLNNYIHDVKLLADYVNG
jgi:hypothetical protein